MNTSILKNFQLKQLQFLQISFTLGPLLFFVACIFLYLNGSGFANFTGEQDSFLIILTAVHFVLLGILFPVSIVLPTRFLNRYKKVKGEESSGRIVVSAHLIRLSIMEIPAIFGLVITLLSILNGVIYEEPLFWVNTASFFICFTQMTLLFPNHERIEQLYGSTFSD